MENKTKMSNEEIIEISMQLISNAGDVKNLAIQAIREAREGNFVKAEELIDSSRKKIRDAHKYQTKLISRESRGESIEISVFLIHAQDHLMNAITIKDLSNEIINNLINLKCN